ncbi:hypothetical protein [Nostoc sp.]|uniref:hypothetical protein n=1 Tax=Nostoc sp. TaxID=1180 RepID=UPI002FF9A16D
MVSQIQPPTQPEVIYPDSDGQTVANNTIQFGWIVEIKQNIEWLFADDPNVFVAGDLFWYPVEGHNTIVIYKSDASVRETPDKSAPALAKQNSLITTD